MLAHSTFTLLQHDTLRSSLDIFHACWEDASGARVWSLAVKRKKKNWPLPLNMDSTRMDAVRPPSASNAHSHTSAHHLNERQRLLPAADQRLLLLPLLLHDGGEGHQWGGGRAAHCSQHPGPEEGSGWGGWEKGDDRQTDRGGELRCSPEKRKCVDKGRVSNHREAPGRGRSRRPTESHDSLTWFQWKNGKDNAAHALSVVPDQRHCQRCRMTLSTGW